MRNLVRWEDPFEGLTSLHSHIDDMFNDFFNASRLPAVAAGAPAMDVYSEGDKNLVVEIQAPGFDKEDIDINVHNGMLEISAEKHDKEEDKDKDKRTYMMRESHASFYRRVALPQHADGDNVQAEFDSGLLKVTVPYKELPKPKKVQIAARAKGEKKSK